ITMADVVAVSKEAALVDIRDTMHLSCVGVVYGVSMLFALLLTNPVGYLLELPKHGLAFFTLLQSICGEVNVPIVEGDKYGNNKLMSSIRSAWTAFGRVIEKESFRLYFHGLSGFNVPQQPTYNHRYKPNAISTHAVCDVAKKQLFMVQARGLMRGRNLALDLFVKAVLLMKRQKPRRVARASPTTSASSATEQNPMPQQPAALTPDSSVTSPAETECDSETSIRSLISSIPISNACVRYDVTDDVKRLLTIIGYLANTTDFPSVIRNFLDTESSS
ncbi:hypothetical protein HDV05_005470, partial [Chytridiales sp. JEL 0842]